jgi:flagellar hook protein FlgE
MMQALLNGMAGMRAFAFGLDIVSGNVTNLNTLGYLPRDAFFRSIGGDRPLGVAVSGGALLTRNGEVQQTGEALDLFIGGPGMFVLRDSDGELLYTRAGNFGLDENNVLIDRGSGHKVMAIDSDGRLVEIDLSGAKVKPAEATTTVKLKGTVVYSDTQSVPPLTVEVFDATGASHKLKIELTRDAQSPRTFFVKITNEVGTVLTATDSRIAFQPPRGTGNPTSGTVFRFSSVTAKLTVAGVEQLIEFDFGTPDAEVGSEGDGVRLVGSASPKIEVKSNNGHGVLGLLSTTFDENGVLKLTYAGGLKEDGPTIALASFNDMSALQSLSGALFKANADTPVRYGRAGDGFFGDAQAGALQRSAVDLVTQMSNVLIYQRGYGASSRLMTVANQMIEQLLENSPGR